MMTAESSDIPPGQQARPKSPFRFLRDGTRKLGGSSTLLPNTGRSALFKTPQPTKSIFEPSAQQPSETMSPADASQQGAATTAPQSTWRNWKKVTFDLYIRLLDRPSQTRVRLKQTLAPLPMAKLKPVIDLGYNGPQAPPVAMHLDVKLLNCLKYRLRPDGAAYFQVRVKTPLPDPRFVMDVTYQHDMQTALDTVKLSFRCLDIAFLKAPRFGGEIKFPIRFESGVKSTLRVKKFILPERKFGHSRSSRVEHAAPSSNGIASLINRFLRPAQPSATPDRQLQRFEFSGPMGMDVKLRCLEFR